MKLVDFSTLPPESIQVLRVIQKCGVVRGFDLQRRAELKSPEELAEAVRPLIEHDLITSSSLLDPASIRRTQFAPLPSARNAASLFLKSKK